MSDTVFLATVMLLTFFMGVLVTKLTLPEQEKPKGVAIADPKKPKRTFIKEEVKAGPIKRPDAETLELRQRSDEEKETAQEWAKKLPQVS